MTPNIHEVGKRRSISPALSRSWLLVNGARPETFGPAAASPADQILLDIEDAVDPARKNDARQSVVEWFRSGGTGWVRINDRSTKYWADDVAALVGLPGIDGVMLAKTESAAHVTETFDRMHGQSPVIALIESALGIEEAVSMAKARGTFRLAFGSGDYRRDTGTAADNLAMAYPRSRLVIASRVGNLPGPIDGPTIGTSHPTLREQSNVAVALGMTGRLCLNIDQLAIVNEALAPTPSDIAWAQDFLSLFEAGGREIRDGSDLPRLRRAEEIQRLARAFGMEPE
ncbi:HpcH/HpaI aldolase/citrate lyase family protein [Lacisediminihabitans profunda]|uniref:CoA ester lyase n=1 Tax=Lacisediminihabitans profunda TaxID=2594790 RepID=A0A5C8UNI0_9MICO|nr:CoA ester lyase [Lacisediminihabitans profunda]TXN29793.1 CoA ester lyase [Lacisediminihabitans profunda]